MEDNVHEVVKLLLARMESHPEEFGDDSVVADAVNSMGDRWWRARTDVMDYGTPEEKAAVLAAMRRIKLKVAHEWMMDELCNGEERRRKQKEDEDRYSRQQAQLQQAKNQYTNPSLYANQLAGAATSTTLANSAMPENLIERLRKKGWI